MFQFLEFAFTKITVGIVVAVTALVSTYCLPSYFRRIWDRILCRIPPGPPAFPILGTIAVDFQHPEETFRKWGAQYGNLFSFFLGTRFCIGVGSMDLIQKLFRDDRFNGRPNDGIFQHLDDDLTKGLAFGQGEIWKEHKRFSVTALRDSGMGKADGSGNIEKEAANLLTVLRKMEGKSFDPQFPFITAAANVLSSILFSDDFRPDDSRFSSFVENVHKNMQEFANSAYLEVYPWLRKIFPFSRKFKHLNARVRAVMQLLMDLVQDHKKTFDSSNQRDYIDAFFCVQECNKKATGSEGTFTDIQLVRNLADIYITGYETTSTFLRWSMLYMILHPEVQSKVQAEIDAVVGPSRLPTFADKPEMHYTDAVITEIHRISSFVPFGVPHCATEDVQFEGFQIPKGTEVWPMVCHHFMNPEVWGDPKVFRPERFLGSDGELVTALVEEIQPYSVGRRVCLGEPLAKMELFNFFGAILQNFTITGQTKPSTVPLVSQVLAPQPFTIIATPR